MWFHTYTYAVFLALVLPAYMLLPPRGRQIMLLAASYLFYCWELPWFGILLVISTILDYAVGRLLERTNHLGTRRLLLGASLAGNLGLLGFYKYADFLFTNAAGLGQWLGFDTSWTPMNLLLPAGISFYTFQTLSYTFQVYRRQYPAEHDVIRFALYVSFFPQLVAGPIERATNLLPQLDATRRITLENFRAGVARIVIGLFRKLVIADRMAIVVDGVFSNPGSCSPAVAWLGVACFCAQIYFDFAGYSDMAIGSARIFGIRLMENFRRPLMATNIAEYWNRWHMSLTGWFRDYLFNVLGGFRKGSARAAFNAFVVMFLCGLWHGASWNFALWGVWHAGALCVYYTFRAMMRKRGRHHHTPGPAGSILRHAAVFLVNAVGIVFFRSSDLDHAMSLFRAMFGFNEATGFPPYLFAYVVLLVGWYGFEFAQEYGSLNERYARLGPVARAAGWALLILVITLGCVNLQTPYLYFQF